MTRPRQVQTHLGVPECDSTDTSGIAAAAEVAAAADRVVMALGVDLSWAHEGHDSLTLEIPPAQMALVAQVMPSCGNNRGANRTHRTLSVLGADRDGCARRARRR